MAQPNMVLLVKFRTPLPMGEVMEVVHARADEFRALPGLIQKYYLKDQTTGEVAGLYLWDSAKALAAFSESELRRTIAKAYQVEGTPRIEVFEVLMPLREG